MPPSSDITAATSKGPSEGDIIFNRASIALAKSQRLIASWLPPTPPTHANAQDVSKMKTQEYLDKEEAEIFIPIPETYVLQLSLPFLHLGFGVVITNFFKTFQATFHIDTVFPPQSNTDPTFASLLLLLLATKSALRTAVEKYIHVLAFTSQPYPAQKPPWIIMLTNTLTPNSLGLGAPLPQAQDGPVSTGSLGVDANAKLRKQMMGGKAAATAARLRRDKAGADEGVFKKPRPASATVHAAHDQGGDEDDDEEGGRTSLGSKNQRQRRGHLDRQPTTTPASASIGNNGDEDRIKKYDINVESTSQSATKKRPGSYLDEILLERSKKKKKKKKNQKNQCAKAPSS